MINSLKWFNGQTTYLLLMKAFGTLAMSKGIEYKSWDIILQLYIDVGTFGGLYSILVTLMPLNWKE